VFDSFKVTSGLLLAASLATSQLAVAAGVNEGRDEPSGPTLHSSLSDAGAYVTAPLHWNRTNWTEFGATIAAVALAHHYDDSVRSHFTRRMANPLDSKNSSDAKDALPAAVLLAGTWLGGALTNSSSSRTAAWVMTESAVLSTATTYLLKAAAGRERPDQTADPNQWHKGGSSFPSLHVSAAFALGTAFAESGTEGSTRWLTRTVGYGIAGLTAYDRLKHNAHWLSDTVAGAAVGTATALFVVHRTYRTSVLSGLTVAPLDHGFMLAYRMNLQ